MTCRGCGTENRAGRKFCVQCGATLELGCPSCGAAAEPGDRFCGECGTALTTGGAAPTSVMATSTGSALLPERRLVTVLFADLVGVTTLSEHRDSEEVREPQFLRARGLLEARNGELAEAETALAQAATILRDTGSPYAYARALLDDGTVLPALDRTGEALTVLQKARSLFVQLSATPWIERTDAALAPVTAVA